MKKITWMQWAVLALVIMLVKVTVLPDTAGFQLVSIILVGICGLGFCLALNRFISEPDGVIKDPGDESVEEHDVAASEHGK